MSIWDTLDSISKAKTQPAVAPSSSQSVVATNFGRNWLGKVAETNPYTGLVTGNYWAQTGMPWVSSEGRKAVLTEWFWQPIRGQPRRVDTNELRTFAQTYWAWVCEQTIIDEITSLDWDIVPKEEFAEVANTPQIQMEIVRIREFLKNPNRNGESWQDVQRAWLKDILELDAGVLVKVYSRESYDFNQLEPKSGAPLLLPMGQRQLTEVYARDGASFLKEVDKFGFCKGFWQYSYQIPAHPVWFNRDEVIYTMQHPRSMSPYGYSPMQAALDIIKTMYYSQLYNKAYFEQGAIPAGMVGLEDTSDAEMERFKETWYNELQGKPWQVPIVNKKIEFTPFQLNNVELQFLETQEWYFRLITTAFKLTPEELGMTQDSNRSTGITQSELMRRKGIKPIIKLLTHAINTQLLPELGSFFTEFQYVENDLIEEKEKAEMEQMQIQLNLRTINEVRRDHGWDPVPWGDGPGNVIMSSGFGGQEENEDGNEENPEETNKDENNKDENPKEKKKPFGGEDNDSDNTDDNMDNTDSDSEEEREDTEEGTEQESQEPQGGNNGQEALADPAVQVQVQQGVMAAQMDRQYQMANSQQASLIAQRPMQADMVGNEFELREMQTQQQTIVANSLTNNNMETEPIHGVKCINCDSVYKSTPKSCKLCTGITFKNLPTQPVGQYYNNPNIQYGINPMQMAAPQLGLPKQLQNSHPEDIRPVGVPSKTQIPQSDQLAKCPTCGFDRMTNVEATQVQSMGAPQGNMMQCPRCKTITTVDPTQRLQTTPTIYQNQGKEGIGYTMPPEQTSNQDSSQPAAIMQAGQPQANTLPQLPNYPIGPSMQNAYGQDRASPADWSPKSFKESFIKDAFNSDISIKSFVGWDTNTLKEYLKEFILKYKFDEITDITQTQKNEIRNIFIRAIEGNYGLNKIAHLVNDVVDDESKSASIARTETVRITNSAQIERHKEMGISKGKWIAQPNVAKEAGHECFKNNGKTFSLEELKKSIPAHPNCNCYYEPIV